MNKKSSSIRVGIIGCGNISYPQINYLLKFINTDAIALCDIEPIKMNYLADEYGIKRLYKDFMEMLRDFQPHSVHVLTPPQTHKTIALKCLEAGAHIFLEKPMCVDESDAVEIISRAREKNRMVCMDHLRVFDPQIEEIKKLIGSGGLGRIVKASTAETNYYLDRKKDGLAPEWLIKLPGEIFYDILPHHLSILNEFIPGLEIKGVSALTDKSETVSDLNCLLSSGNALASIYLSSTAHPQNKLELECTRGIITADLINRVTVTSYSNGPQSLFQRLGEKISIGRQNISCTLFNLAATLIGKKPETLAGMERLFHAYYTSVRDDVCDSPIPGEKGLAVLRQSNQAVKELKPHDVAIFEPIKVENPKSARVLVTGGTGFIGKTLVKRLVASGQVVRLLLHTQLKDDVFSNTEMESLELIRGDIANPLHVEKAMKDIETVFHLAAATKGSAFYHLDATVKGTRNIVEACISQKVKKLVYVSTIAILAAPSQNGNMSEDSPYEPYPLKRGIYSYAKLKAEEIVNELKSVSGISVSIIRPGLVYGPDKPLLFMLTKKQIAGNTYIALESPRRILPLLHVHNLVDALMLAGQKGPAWGVYNLVDDETLTAPEMLKAYAKTTGGKIRCIFFPHHILKLLFMLLDAMILSLLEKKTTFSYNLFARGQKRIYPNQKIRSELGWQQNTTLLEGMQEMSETGRDAQ